MARRKKAARKLTRRKARKTSKAGKASKAAKTTRKQTTRRRATRASAPASRFPEVEELVDLMNRHGLAEVDFESGADGSRRIRVARGGAALPGAAPAPAVTTGAPAPAAPMPDVPAAAAPAVADEGLHAFTSPMVGTFYRAPSPEASAFVSVGDRVDPAATVCIIEAMKVMNEITPDASGEIVSIEVENGEAVEFGQTLFLIRTS